MSNTIEWLDRLIEAQASKPSRQRYPAADTAVLRPPAGHSLAASMDTLICDVHFTMAASPADIGHKALAVNLSDLAAIGAEPIAALLSLSATALDGAWLTEFACGVKALADRFGVQLPAGTLNEGPLTITVTIYGHLPASQALRRDNAAVGDHVFVTGTLGDAGLALALARGQVLQTVPPEPMRYLQTRLHRPEPRIAAGIALRGLASAAIDVSDGLLADLHHVLTASGVGATVDTSRLPLSQAMIDTLDSQQARQLALTAGDDYELCFTVPPSKLAQLQALQAQCGCPIQHIGYVESHGGLRCFDEASSWWAKPLGYRHFG